MGQCNKMPMVAEKNNSERAYVDMCTFGYYVDVCPSTFCVQCAVKLLDFNIYLFLKCLVIALKIHRTYLWFDLVTDRISDLDSGPVRSGIRSFLE